MRLLSSSFFTNGTALLADHVDFFLALPESLSLFHSQGFRLFLFRLNSGQFPAIFLMLLLEALQILSNFLPALLQLPNLHIQPLDFLDCLLFPFALQADPLIYGARIRQELLVERHRFIH